MKSEAINTNTPSIQLLETILENFSIAFPEDFLKRSELVDQILVYGNKCRSEGIEMGIQREQMKDLF
tara:strand:+ start:13794 stop:13994 length:201 start_codon:yes stop_codon:yes gene_type:complete